MKIETYRNNDPNTIEEGNPENIIKEALNGFDLVLEFIEDINPKIHEDYIKALMNNLQEDIGDYRFNSEVFDLKSYTKKLTRFNEYPEIQDLIIQLVCKHMKVPKDYHPEQGTFELLEIDYSRAFMLWRFYRVKAFIDILSREKGIEFWKNLVIKFADHSLKNNEEMKPINEIAEGWIKFGRENRDTKQMDFTAVVFDDNRVLFKIDRCVVHECLKYLNDPELSYLSYCYMGDIKDKRSTQARRRRRTRTLYFGELCDEFYWDNVVVPDAKHPPLEFMRKLGKEKPEEIIKEFQGKV